VIETNLGSLMQNFKPQRVFSCSHTTIEVDGVFVRVPNDGDNSWVPLTREFGKGHHLAVDIEDMLQDPGIIRSARVSTGRDSSAVNEKAKGLIGYLWKDRHVTPSGSGVVFRLKQDTPIGYAQPFFRLFAEHNELSGRYSKLDGPYYTPRNIGYKTREEFDQAEQEAQELYGQLIDMGIAKEMARLVHLYRFRTRFYQTIGLRYLLEFLTWKNVTTRHGETEFYEVRDVIKQVLKHWTPWAFESFKQYPNSIDFSWVNEYIGNYRNQAVLSQVLDSRNVLNKGNTTLLRTFGQENHILSCLDDYPNPLKAFGHGGMTFSMSVPIHVFRQWVRHRNGHWTERRVDFDSIVLNDSFFVPENFRKQKGKVGHYEYVEVEGPENDELLEMFAKHRKACLERYSRLRNRGVAAEIAAMNLPYCFYIPVDWSVSIESLFNFFSLRCDGHAQFEIRQYANSVWDMFAKSFPVLAKVFAKNIHFGDSELIKKFV